MISRKFRAAVAVPLALLVAIGLSYYYLYHARIESFDYFWFPRDTYAPALKWPSEEKGQPRVVLVRSVGKLQCYSIYYDKRLASMVERNPTRPVRVKFRVKVRFGYPYWIEVVDTAGDPSIAWGQLGQLGRGECF